jgi:hypothetical protein
MKIEAYTYRDHVIVVMPNGALIHESAEDNPEEPGRLLQTATDLKDAQAWIDLYLN